MRTAILLLLVAACGRVGFGGDGDDDARPPDDAAGSAAAVRWAVTIGNNVRFMPLAGSAGAPVIAYAFNGSTTIAGQPLTGTATNVSSAVARFDAAGALVSTAVLDASTTCDIRGVTMRGDTALVAGLAFGNGGDGACNVSAARQDPIILSVDPAGAVSRIALGTASGANAQAWNVRVLPDDTLLASGIYSMGLAFGATALPAAGADPNGYIARLPASQPDALWAIGMTGGVQVTAGPIALDGSELCMLGGYQGAGLTEFGKALPYVGSADALVVRLDATGATRFVRGFGSPGQDSYFNDGSVAALGGGCIGSIAAPGDVTIDGTPLPASDGAGIVAWFDGAGALAGAYRLPSTAELAVVGTRVIGAYTVSAAVTIGGTTYTPRGQDIVVVELSATGPTRLLDVVGGDGDQSLIRLAAIGPSTIAMTLASAGDFELGTTSFTSAPNDRVLAVLGI
ncbi:MAG TPA: hypothetical protein VLT45_15095 [Kofleriaceae bacterium]|nr:hypothetical protein [Kofleriaceae bacterium]